MGEVQNKNQQVQQEVQRSIILAILADVLAIVMSTIPGFVWPFWSPKRVDETQQSDFDGLSDAQLKQWSQAVSDADQAQGGQ